MQTKSTLLCAAFAAALLSACGDRSNSTPAPASSAPAATAPSSDHPSEPAAGQNTNPTTAAPAPGAGEGASAATDPSQKK